MEWKWWLKIMRGVEIFSMDRAINNESTIKVFFMYPIILTNTIHSQLTSKAKHITF